MANSGDKGYQDGWAKVDESEIDTILRTLSRNFPDSIQIYNFIKMGLMWSKQSPDIISTVFHNTKSQASVVATLKGPEYAVAVFVPKEDEVKLVSFLQGNNIINWNGPIIFIGIQLNIGPCIKDTVSRANRIIIENDIYGSYWMPSITALAMEVNCPEDMYFSKLEVKHADLVNSMWPHSSGTSLHLIQHIINVNDTVGLFTKKDSVLVSWVLNTFYGIGMLFTLVGYRKKGYGTLVMKKLLKSLGEKSINPTVLTLTNNVSAKSVFLQLGFEVICPVEAIKLGSY